MKSLNMRTVQFMFGVRTPGAHDLHKPTAANQTDSIWKTAAGEGRQTLIG